MSLRNLIRDAVYLIYYINTDNTVRTKSINIEYDNDDDDNINKSRTLLQN